MTASPVHPVDVLLLLTHADEVLLALRHGTGFADGQWNLPSGKLERGEHALDAVAREAYEEIGVRFDPADLRLAATVHRRNTDGSTRIGLVFAAEFVPARHTEPVNAEPHKCAGIGWFPAGRFPSNTLPYTADCVTAARNSAAFTLSGWS
ncbi:NUDIX hydrolase [Solwaraspora sp. WMMB335]|uniref:NUDIX hydrolase n=1 Tax=Solwaraspora sp. WMMB335 TaxID=3404118 RepID=UPI003B958263